MLIYNFSYKERRMESLRTLRAIRRGHIPLYQVDLLFDYNNDCIDFPQIPCSP